MILPEKNQSTEHLVGRAFDLGKTTSLITDEHAAQMAVNTYRSSAHAVLRHYEMLAKKTSKARFMNREIESILDNFFIIETTVFDVINAFKKRDFKKFPLITLTKDEKSFRLYSVLREFIKETKGRVNKEDLLLFIAEYQRLSPFSIRELNMVPIMLRFILVEDFDEIVLKARTTIDEYEKAEEVYVSIVKAAKKSSWDPSKTTLGLARSYGIVPLNFGIHLISRLSQDGSKMRPIIKWIRLNLEKQGLSSGVLSSAEEGTRTDQFVRISNITESLHWLNQVRWDAIAEKINVVDAILVEDPSRMFSMLDVETKNAYRNVVVRIAERVSIHEAEVARVALRLASQQKQTSDSLVASRRHVGYYLIDPEGRSTLEKEIKYIPTKIEKWYRWVLAHPARSYFGIILTLSSTLFVAALSKLGFPTHVSIIWIAWAISFFMIALEIGIHASNLILTRFLPVRRMPRLQLEGDLGPERRTFVVIPSMLRSEASLVELVSKLETRYVGNAQKNLYYALLLDFSDASTETLPTDVSLIDSAQKKIQTLNDTYAGLSEKKFFVLIRKRIWNENEGVFMAWERKRGKLREFNELMRGHTTSYTVTGGAELVQGVKYVITLDEDTELPHDSARRLVGTIAHPLNTPVVDSRRGKVVRGYGIIQPRVSVRLSTATRSVYSRLFSSVSGIDSYSGPVSDVYQDLFDNALFFGKGIYDIDAVEASMKGKIPDNTVLSHDLLEGIYARTGFASDIVLFDGFPKFYHEFIVRLERWIRGDWQIIGWLSGKFGQGQYGVPVERFAIIDRFKIFDNLRRSLVPVAAVSALFIGYSTDVSLKVTTIFIAIALVSPYALPFIVSLVEPTKAPFRLRLRKWIDDVLMLLCHGSLRVFFLFEQACVSVWAIVRTLGRLYITRRKLLQWKISHDVGVKLVGSLPEYYRAMRLSVVLSLVLLASIFFGATFDQWMVSWCLVWVIAPCIAFFISLRTQKKEHLDDNDRVFVRGIAYRNALYFIENAKKETNWLIPDHVQEYPKVTGDIRPSTSPTNIGMHITSLIVAYELGYISIVRYADRLERLFGSLSRLTRHRGHFLNWYDIEKLESLAPQYVSSVDSANLLLALIAAERSYIDISNRPLVNHEMGQGVVDALREFSEDMKAFQKIMPRAMRKDLVALQNALSVILEETKMLPQLMPRDYLNKLTLLHRRAGRVVQMTRDAAIGDPRPSSTIPIALLQSVMGLIEDQMLSIQTLLPYVRHLDHSAELYATHDSIILKLVHSIEKEAVSGTTLRVVAEEIPRTIRSFEFVTSVNNSTLSDESKRFLVDWYVRLLEDVDRGALKAREIMHSFRSVADEANRYVKEADFSFLYNKEKELFHIGYNVAFDKLDSACYNFMASESNSVSFVAILKGQAPQKHWFYLSRKLVRSGGLVSLVSWGGSLFEYLTSLIFFSTHKESLLGATARSAIRVHMNHARKHRTLWGMGESAYAVFDAAKRYQYQVFGSDQIGLKRNLGDFLVVAPYVTALALPIVPKASVRNMRRFVTERMRGRYGFYDALDYIGKDSQRLKKPVPAQIYYAHHQGFTLASIHNVLSDGRIQELFHSHPMVRSLDVLFEERMPDAPVAEPLSIPIKINVPHSLHLEESGAESRRFIPVHPLADQYSFLSNEDYSVRISHTGRAMSYYKGIALSRPSTDSRVGGDGTSVYIRTSPENIVQILPNHTHRDGKKKIVFEENKAEFMYDIDSLETHISISVDPKMPVCVREFSITNKAAKPVSIDVAGYGEVSLAYENQVLHHPHYHHLLVRSEIILGGSGILFSRPHPGDRSRSIYFAHFVVRHGAKGQTVRCFAHRGAAFSGYESFDPFALVNTGNEEVPVVPLDPAFTLITKVDIKPDERTTLLFVEIAAESRDDIMRLVKKMSHERSARSVVSGATAASALVTRSQGISQSQAVVFQNIAGAVLSGLRHRDTGTHTASVVSSLWRMGVSGDYPIALFAVHDIGDIPTVRQIIQCFAYWKSKNIDIDIVILNSQPTSYMKVFDDEVDFLIRQARENIVGWSKSTLYQVKAELVSNEDKATLFAVARFVADTTFGTFADAVKICVKDSTIHDEQKRLKVRSKHYESNRGSIEVKESRGSNLALYNSWGGFDAKTNEYVMTLSSEHMPPKPWSHIIANEKFGTIVTSSGSTHSWSYNSYDNRVTALSNDSLRYKTGEIIYIRDRQTGVFWNPTPFPVKTKAQFDVRYGFGYATYSHVYSGISSEMTTFVPNESSTKISILKLTNNTAETRSLTVYNYVSPVMGVMRNNTTDHLRFDLDLDNKVLFFENGFRDTMRNRTAFVAFGNTSGSMSATTLAKEFIGITGTYENPLGVRLESLSNTVISGSDSCVAIALEVMLGPGETKCIPVLVGESATRQEALTEKTKWSYEEVCDVALRSLKHSWQQKISAVQVKTGDQSIDFLANGWLLYQTLSSRLYAKTGYYQPSGAYGFRDQLQDISALLWSDPSSVRAFILKACSRQFIEGDPLTWWHEYNMFGMRTVLSDHQLWLAHTVYEYIDATGDSSVLDEQVAFVEGPQLSFSGQREWTGIPRVSNQSASVYEHVMRAIEKSLVFGDHGLPLMGHSDWNDGLSGVGQNGRGESVWTAWFLARLLDRTFEYVRARGETNRLEAFTKSRNEIKDAIEKHAWDGRWYRRAFFDNGAPLGSRHLKEFKIDAIAQSWAVLSKVGDTDRIITAHQSMAKHLIKHTYFALIDPALSMDTVNPGYIKDYPAGIRENGAQYNHGAIWAIQSFSAIGDISHASRILDFVNPAKRSMTMLAAKQYGIEPYVVASDVYGGERAGEGGWSWYTGSAGLLYRTIIEHLFGVTHRGDVLSIAPHIPLHWTNPTITIRQGFALYEIRLNTSKGSHHIESCLFDGKSTQASSLSFKDDGKKHVIEIALT